MGILELSPHHSDFFLSRENNLYSLALLIAFQLEFFLTCTWADSNLLWVGHTKTQKWCSYYAACFLSLLLITTCPCGQPTFWEVKVSLQMLFHEINWRWFFFSHALDMPTAPTPLPQGDSGTAGPPVSRLDATELVLVLHKLFENSVALSTRNWSWFFTSCLRTV